MKDPTSQFDPSAYLDELPCIYKLGDKVSCSTDIKNQQFREEQLEKASRNEQAMAGSYSFEAEPKIETSWFWGYANKKNMDCISTEPTKEPISEHWSTCMAKRGPNSNGMRLTSLQQPHEVQSPSAGMDMTEQQYQKRISQMERSIENANIYLEALKEANRVYTSVGTLRQSAEVLRYVKLAVKAAERSFALATSLLTEGVNVNNQEEVASTLLYASSLELWKARAIITRQTAAARVLQRTIKLWKCRSTRLIPQPKQ